MAFRKRKNISGNVEEFFRLVDKKIGCNALASRTRRTARLLRLLGLFVLQEQTNHKELVSVEKVKGMRKKEKSLSLNAEFCADVVWTMLNDAHGWIEKPDYFHELQVLGALFSLIVLTDSKTGNVLDYHEWMPVGIDTINHQYLSHAVHDIYAECIDELVRRGLVYEKPTNVGYGITDLTLTVNEKLLGNSNRNERESIAPTLRFAVFQRDNFKCVYCGRGADDGVKLHADHKIPAAFGGETTLDNLVTACDDCNRGKQTKIVEMSVKN